LRPKRLKQILPSKGKMVQGELSHHLTVEKFMMVCFDGSFALGRTDEIIFTGRNFPSMKFQTAIDNLSP